MVTNRINKKNYSSFSSTVFKNHEKKKTPNENEAHDARVEPTCSILYYPFNGIARNRSALRARTAFCALAINSPVTERWSFLHLCGCSDILVIYQTIESKRDCRNDAHWIVCG